MNELPIIILSAPACSGKSEVFAHLCKKNYIGIDMGSFLKEILELNTESRKNKVLTIREKLIEYGRERMITQLLENLHSMYKPDTKGFIICGMRSVEDMRILYNNSENPKINIFLYADPSKCYDWNKKRMRNGDPIDFISFIKIYYEEIYAGIGKLINDFEFEVVINDSNLENLINKVDVIISNRIK